jgi:AraC-like DNA-binding protein
MAWYQDQRLHEARRLLDDGVPGDEAARRCGYHHHRNLLRALRRHGLRS